MQRKKKKRKKGKKEKKNNRETLSVLPHYKKNIIGQKVEYLEQKGN
jgi:hypothetical protein